MYKNTIRKTALIKHCGKASYKPIGVDNGAMDYSTKTETRIDGPWEFGEKPFKRNSKTDWEEVKKLAKEGKIDQVPADIYVRNIF